MKFASETEVSAERSKAEIESVLRKYGADQFISGWDGTMAMIGFRARGRMVRFVLPLPDKEAYRTTEGGQTRHQAAHIEKAWEQGIRQRWRALLLAIKAKLEAVESGIATFEQEFLAHIVLPDNTTVGDFLTPQLDEVYKSKKMPLLLPSHTK